MISPDEWKASAIKYLRAADHMLTQTYPSLREPKILLAVLNNTFLSIEYGMSALLYHERALRKIPPFQQGFESKFNMFKMKTAPMNRLTEWVMFIQQMRDLTKAHKESMMEFSRRGDVIIASDEYELKKLSANALKMYIAKSKNFISIIDRLMLTGEIPNERRTL